MRRLVETSAGWVVFDGYGAAGFGLNIGLTAFDADGWEQGGATGTSTRDFAPPTARAASLR